jgi:transposase
LAASSDRAEADRARSILLTLSGWTSGRIAQAFGVREDTVRLWRSEFIKSGVEELKTHISPGPEPVKAQAALKVAEVLLAEPVANRTNWTLPRLITEIEQREGVRISKSRLSVVLRQKGGSVSAGRGTR